MHASELALKHLLLEQLAKSALAPVPNPVKEEDKGKTVSSSVSIHTSNLLLIELVVLYSCSFLLKLC